MKRILGEYPYNDYYLYMVFHKKEGRRYVNLIPIDKNSGLKRHTMSYARYLISVKEKRVLAINEHVDHKDNNKLNDCIENLQIVSLKENNIKEAKRRGRKIIILKCPNCEKIFERSKRQTHLQKGNTYTACCRKCSSTFGVNLWRHPDDVKLLQKLIMMVMKILLKNTSNMNKLVAWFEARRVHQIRFYNPLK